MSYYCLNCRTPNNCKCGTAQYRFHYSHKLRVPTTTKNKVKFRKFLDDCPQFVNMVPENLQPLFLDLLRELKYFNTTINGFKWTNINK